MALKDRYKKNHSSLSAVEMIELGQKRVLVVGCGGLGGYIIEELARIGVGALRVVDGDRFEQSNLNRQLFCTEATLGLKKAEVAKRRIAEINSGVTVEAFPTYLDDSNAGALVCDCDCVVDALDSIQARQILCTACLMHNVPLVHGAIAGWFGRVGVSLPGDGAGIFTDALGCSWSSNGDSSSKGIELQLGNLAPTAAVVASIQAAEVLKVLLHRADILQRKLLMIDLEHASFEMIDLS